MNGLQGPYFKYLTNAYVEALGLEHSPVDRGPVAVSWLSENGAFPTVMRAFDICVAYNHGLYAREADGLAWSLR